MTQTTRPLVHFGHANGFPSGSYGAFFEALGADIDVISIPKLGHNPRYAISPNWHGLGDELADSVRAQADGRPVIALGHSLGGMCSLIAAHRDPSLFQGIILMDPATINPVSGVVVAVMKAIGQIDRITPAGRSKGRRAHWPSAQAMHDSLRNKGLFKAFSNESFKQYMEHGLIADGDGVRLVYEPEREVEIFRHTPSDTWRYWRPLNMPRVVMTGASSEFLSSGNMLRLAKAQGVQLEITSGNHMFPLEQPELTAARVREHILAIHAGTHPSQS
ncbi:MAG: alpha/beta hydrolase [Paraperlucidibaca sp.]